MDFSMTFTLGDIIQVVSFVSVILLAWSRLNDRMARIEEKYVALAKDFADISVRLDRVEERTDKEIKGMRKDMSEGLRRIYDKLDGKQDKD